jgi:type IV pilus assembly protein PilX
MPAARAQRGVVLFIALIVLVAMTLAGIAIMRSVDTGNLIAGNVAFKQGTLQGGDLGANSAIKWLEANAFTGKLDNDSPDDAYNAQGDEPNWSDDAAWADAKTAGTDKAGNTVQYKINRLCKDDGPPQNNNCAKVQKKGTEAGTSAGTIASYAGPPPDDGQVQVLYRITTRVVGPREATSIIQFNVVLPQ